MKSMTGFGTASASREGTSVTVELASVNSKKGAELRFLIPREMGPAIEGSLRPLIQKRLARGSLTTMVRYQLGPDLLQQRVAIDHDLARAVAADLTMLSQELGLEPVSIHDVLQVPGVISEKSELPGELLGALAQEAFGTAWDQFEQMRKEEGGALATALTSHLDAMEGIRNQITAVADEVLQAHHQKLRDRLRLLGLEMALDDERLLKEVAFCAERADIHEELIRLESHFSQFRKLLEADDAVGRSMEFLCQEIGREINTLGAKVSDSAQAQLALEFRSELDRLVEQIRNVE